MLTLLLALPALAIREEPVESYEVLKNKLWVEVYSHDIKQLTTIHPCWTFQSKGLQAVGQKEIRITVERKNKERLQDIPVSYFQYYASVFKLAERGDIVDVGDISVLGIGLGNKNFNGVIYTWPEDLEGVPESEQLLTGILFRKDELEAIERVGVLRVLALLSQKYQYYPVPPWADFKRRSVIPKKESFFDRVAANHVGVIVATLYDQPGGLDDRMHWYRLVVEFKGEIQMDGMVNQMSESSPGFILATSPGEVPGGYLVWRPDIEGIDVITLEGSFDGMSVQGAFVAFVLAEGEETINPLEDGFVVLVSPENWPALKEALLSRRSSTFKVGGLELELIFTAPEAPHTSP
jgi:hypothetical protein